MNEITEPSVRKPGTRPTASQFAADIQELVRALKAGELVLELDLLEALKRDLTSFLDHEWRYGVEDDLTVEDVTMRWHATPRGDQHDLLITIDAVVGPAT